MNKPIKPTNLIPRSFGGVKNNFSASLQSSGYEDGIPAIYGGDNLNYQLDCTGKELDYCEKICDFINAIPIGNTISVDTNNKLVYINNLANTDLSNLSLTGQAVIDNKADINLSNVTDTAKILMSSMGMPSGTYENLTLPASGGTVKAPADGWLYLSKHCTAVGQYIQMMGNNLQVNFQATTSISRVMGYFPVKANTIVTIEYTAAGATGNFRFVYAEGSTSLSS